MVMTETIRQSDMDFITNNIFHIENSTIYKKISSYKIRSVEFIRIMNNELLFIEAKTTFPNPENPSEENKIKFQNEIGEICEKYIHSLNLFSSIELGVDEEEYKNDFSIPVKGTLVFLLVVKNHKIEWCVEIKRKLEQELPHYLKRIWKPKVFVINHTTAIQLGLTVN